MTKKEYTPTYEVNAFKINAGPNKGYYTRRANGRCFVAVAGKQYPIKAILFAELSKTADTVVG